MITHGLGVGNDIDNFMLFGFDVHQTSGVQQGIILGKLGYHIFRLVKLGTGFVSFNVGNLTANRMLTVPDKDGTIATVEDLEDIHRINWQYGDITEDVDGATITFDMEESDKHTVTLGGNRTLAVENVHVGQTFTIILVQDATGSRTVTWFSGISWPSASTPTLTTTANKRDVFQFMCVSPGVYFGFTMGLNL